MSNTQVRTFTAQGTNKLESEINNWLSSQHHLERIVIIDTNQSVITHENTQKIIVTIFYQRVKK